jgi:hypothetical protein
MDHQAFAQLLGNYGEFVGAIAVVVTLVYLSVQVKHSKDATEFNSKQVEQANLLALSQNQIARVNLIERQIRDLADSSELAEIFVRYKSQGLDALDEVEQFRFWNWQIIQHYILDSQHYQYTLGMVDDESWQDAVRRIQNQISIWDDLDMQGIGRQSFIDEVDRIRQARS